MTKGADDRDRPARGLRRSSRSARHRVAGGRLLRPRGAPGHYNLLASCAGYRDVSVNDIRLAPGEQRDVGLLRLAVARGALSGSVVLDDGLNPAGTAITLVPLQMPGAEPITTIALADGSFHVPELAVGSYRLRAEKANYAPAYTDEGIEVREYQRQTAPTLRLYPAAAIVKVERDGLPVRFTNSREVSAVLLPFVEFLEAMRLSEDPTFDDPRWDTDYRELSTPVDFTLADEEGQRTIFAQFRDSLGIESEVFSGQVVLDHTAPAILSVTLNGGAQYLTAADGAGRATLAFTAHDALAGVDAWRYTLAAEFSDEPFQPLDSVGATVVDVQTVELGDEDGPKTLRLQLRDRAGNLSTAEPATIWRDKTPPALGSPALALDPSSVDGAGTARSLDVRLVFDVRPDREGEQLYVAVANGPGLDAHSAFVPLTSPMAHRLAEARTRWPARSLRHLPRRGRPLDRAAVPERHRRSQLRDRAGNLSDRFEDSIDLDTTAPDVPVLFAVGAYTPDNTPKLSFAPVAGATAYRLQLSDDASFQGAGSVSKDELLSVTSYTPPDALADGTYYWRVKAIDEAGLQSSFSPVDIFRVDTEPPETPVPNAVDSPSRSTRPVLSWSAVGDGALYFVEIDSVASLDSGVDGAPLHSLSPTSTSVSPNLSHGVWYWRVRAQDRAGNDSAPSATLSVEIDTQAPANPTLASPEDGALVASRTLTLSWNQVADAAYLVDFPQAADLASYERVEASSTFKGITVAADGDWYWRVLARDAAGNLSDASAAPVIRRVAIDTAAPEVPSLVAVATPTNDNTPTLSWSSVSDAADYVVTLDGSSSVVTGIDDARPADRHSSRRGTSSTWHDSGWATTAQHLGSRYLMRLHRRSSDGRPEVQ